MTEEQSLFEFPVQQKGKQTYIVAVKSILAVAGDRYGYKHDHLSAWVTFEPDVGSVMGTFIDFPIKHYTPEKLVSDLKALAEVTVASLIIAQREERAERAVKAQHKTELDAVALEISWLLKAHYDKTG